MQYESADFFEPAELIFNRHRLRIRQAIRDMPEPDMEAIGRSLADIKAGRFRSIEDVIADQRIIGEA